MTYYLSLNRYRETIEQQPARHLRQNITHQSFIRTH